MRRCSRKLLLSAASSVAAVLANSLAWAQVQQPPSSGDRVLGLDVSAHQGNWSQQRWNNIHNVENRDFAFIRSSRGGTTGEDHRQGGYPSGNNTFFNLSERYDDPYFIQNITSATNAGMLAGAYHFGRADVIASTTNSGGIANTGTDEANHFLQMAGPWMRPGYLLPVFDFEAGDTQRTDAQLTQFAIDFANRVYAVKGIRPQIYINGSYASIVANSGGTLPTDAVNAMPTMWSARWPNQTDPDSIPVQTMNPGDSIPSVYGPWDNVQGADPWKFWQYASTAHLASYSTTANLDVDVAHGNIEYLRDQQVPALWTSATDGTWTTLSNWNSGQVEAMPTPGSGQLTPAGVTTDNWAGTYRPAARLPGALDNVDLDRPNENITVTLSSGAQTVRRIDINERLNVTGGSLDAALTGQVGAGGTLSLSGGTVTFTQAYVNSGGVLNFSGAGTLNVGTLFLAGDPTFTGASGTGQILPKAGVATPLLDMQGGTRTFNVADGSTAIDMRIGVPIANGTLNKDGNGTLELTGNNSANVVGINVNRGFLNVTGNSQLGIGGVVQGQNTVSNFGGTVRVNGNGLNIIQPIVLNGTGATPGSSTTGALENIAGTNTWSGAVKLNGTGTSINSPTLNQVYAATGTTLNLTGVIQNQVGVASAAWAKTGDGDVVLGGAGANTYNGLTRVFGGRLIIEKDGALGTAGSSTTATGNTFQLSDVSSSIAFRAPSGSGGLIYNTIEWLFTDGTGIGSGGNGQGQIDSLGGANTFAGSVGLGGPTVNGTVESYLGVSAGSLEIKGGVYAKSQSGPVARNIYKRGIGTLIFSGDSSGTPTNNGQAPAPNQGQAGALVNSSFTIQAGIVQLKGTAGNTANMPGVTSWNVNSGGTLSLTQGGAAGPANLVMNGGTLRPEATMSMVNPLSFIADSTIDAGGSIVATMGGAVSGTGGLTKANSGQVRLTGAVNNFRGALSVTGGRVTIAQNGDDTRVANLNGITLTGGAQLDLSDNDLVVRTTPAATVEGFVRSGFNGGAWNGSNAIISSTAQANAWIYTLGVADNARLNLPTFSGQTGLTGAETLVKYTIVGDADLSGAVNAADFARFKAGFANEMPDLWTFGDFDYNGVVDGNDWNLYLYGFLNQPGATMTPAFNYELVTFAVDNGFDPTAVPEPGSLSLLALGAGMMLLRLRLRPSPLPSPGVVEG